MMFRTIAGVACLAAAMEEDQTLLAVKEHTQSNKTTGFGLATMLMTGGLPSLPCSGLSDCKAKYQALKGLACDPRNGGCKQSLDDALVLVGGNKEQALRMMITAAGLVYETRSIKGLDQSLCDNHVSTECKLNLLVGKAEVQPQSVGGTPGDIIDKVLSQSTQDAISSCLQAVPLAVAAGDTFGCGTAVEAGFACVANCPVTCQDAMDVVGVSCPADPCPPGSLIQEESGDAFWNEVKAGAQTLGNAVTNSNTYQQAQQVVTNGANQVVQVVQCQRAQLMKGLLTTTLQTINDVYDGVCTDAELATLCP